MADWRDVSTLANWEVVEDGGWDYAAGEGPGGLTVTFGWDGLYPNLELRWLGHSNPDTALVALRVTPSRACRYAYCNAAQKGKGQHPLFDNEGGGPPDSGPWEMVFGEETLPYEAGFRLSLGWTDYEDHEGVSIALRLEVLASGAGEPRWTTYRNTVESL